VIVVLAAVLALAGCDRSNPLASATLYPVKGKVVLPDGKPLTSGRIVFAATKSTVTAPAPIEKDGSFTIKGSLGDGLPEGEYKVHLEVDESTSQPVKGALPRRKAALPFPAVYSEEDKSPLRATVKPGENVFEFPLKK
jgi:hypothetical protein